MTLSGGSVLWALRLVIKFMLVKGALYKSKISSHERHARLLEIDYPVLERMLIVSNCKISTLTVCVSASRRVVLGRLRLDVGTARRGLESVIRLCTVGLLIIALSGDIELNPGPTTTIAPAPHCGVCQTAGRRNQLFVRCNVCKDHTHRTCANLSTSSYRVIKKEDTNWTCWKCALPNLSDSFFNISVGSSLNNSHSNHKVNRCNMYKGNVSCLSFNARSLKGNKKRGPLIQAWIEEVDASIICVCETWLNSSVQDAEIMPDNYSVFRKDRLNNSHGGVLLAVKPELKPTRVPALENDAEIVWVEISCGEDRVLVGSAYRAPNSNVASNLQLIESVNRAQDVQHQYTSVVLCGDFNLEVDWEVNGNATPKTTIANDILTAFLNVVPHQMVTEATRITKSSRSIIDLVLTNNPGKLADLVVVTGVSDHMAIKFNLKWQCPKPKVIHRLAYNYNKANWKMLENSFSANMPMSTTTDDVETLWAEWKESFWRCVNAAIPQVNIKGRRKSPWITKNIMQMFRKRERLYARFKKNNNIENWETYRRMRNMVKIETRKAHDEYVWKLGDGNSKQLWKYVHGKVGSSAPRHFVIDDVKVTNSQSIAEAFSRTFKDNFSRNLHADSDDLCPPHVSNNHNVNEKQQSSFQAVNFSPWMVFQTIKTIKPDGATGPDGIPSKIVHKCAKVLAPSLSHLFSISMNCGELPKEWKLANVVPIFKTGRKDCTSNYRPISLTSVICKIMEKIVNYQMLQYLQSIKAINRQQHGFLPKRSCVTMLLSAIDDWQFAMDAKAGTHIDVISLDWAKAFDRVPHKRLLMKLQRFNIRGCIFQWLRSFLSERKMKVIFDGASSTQSQVLSGVPQGSVLGPLLFTIYMMDLPQCINSTIRQYADDCTLYRIINSPEDERILQNDLNSIQLWCVLNYMSLNEQKCNHIVLTKSRRSNTSVYYVNNKLLARAKAVKILGLTITQDLKWNTQTEIVRNRAAKLLGFLSRTVHSAKPRVKRMLYISLIRSVMTYGCPAWHPSTKANVKKLESIQNRATKFITGRKDCNSKERLTLSRLLSLENNLKLVDVVFLKKMFANEIDLDPLARVQLSYRSVRYDKGVKLCPPFARTSQYQDGFYCRSVALFNSMDFDTRNLRSTKEFKAGVRRSLLE
jgi:Reverse transcriptase (RNA-dependent DNA polymerase)/Endonuclease-reverse transcriptase